MVLRLLHKVNNEVLEIGRSALG